MSISSKNIDEVRKKICGKSYIHKKHKITKKNFVSLSYHYSNKYSPERDSNE